MSQYNLESQQNNRAGRKFLSAIVIVVSALLFISVLLTLRLILGEMSLENLPTGDYIGRYDSPTKHYTLAVYRCSGTLTDFAIRANLKDNKAFFDLGKNIYWAYHERDASVKWLDDNTVRINDRVLNVEFDVYDFRKDKRAE